MKPPSPDSMRRWTVLLVSHDSEAPRTWSLSEKAIRVGVLLGVAVSLVAMIGLGTVIANLGSLSPKPAARVASVGGLADSEVSPEVRGLRHRVARLQGVLDTIRQQEAQLRVSAGMPKTDSTTIAGRFLALVPPFLKPRTLHGPSHEPSGTGANTSVSSAGALSALVWSDSAATVADLGRTGASADSLADHALLIASSFRELASMSRIRRDTMQVFSLRPESLTVALARGAGTSLQGDVVAWMPERASAVAAGVDAVVTRLLQTLGGRWEMELRAVGGTVAHISAFGRPLVRVGEKVAKDQLVLVVDAATNPPVPENAARITLRQNGVPVVRPAEAR